MHVAVYLPLLLAVPLILGLRLLARRVPPRAASWLVLAGACAVAASTVLCLALLLCGGLAGWAPVASWGNWSVPVLRTATPVPLPLGLAAGALLGAAVTAAAVTVLRYLRSRRGAARRARELPAPLVVLDDPTPVAYALPGGAGRVVISRGMLRCLDADGRRALLAHEQAHLRCRHHLFLAAVRLLSVVNPLLVPLRRTITYTTERWADEVAAAAVGDRAVLARAIATAALATRPGTPPAALAVTAGPVPLRVAALLGAAEPGARTSRTRLVAMGAAAVTAGLLALTAASTADATSDLHENIEVAQCANQHATAVCAAVHPDTPLTDLVAAAVGLTVGGR